MTDETRERVMGSRRVREQDREREKEKAGLEREGYKRERKVVDGKGRCV